MVGVSILVMAVLETNLDYKAVAAKLQNDLRKSMERVKELEGRITVLEDENELQARNYVDLKRVIECDALKKRLQPKTKIVNDELLEDLELEKKFEEVMNKKLTSFKKFTNMAALSSYLIEKGLLTKDEWVGLDRIQPPSHQSMKFYTDILPRKGSQAYRLFCRCLDEATQEECSHEGHRDLLNILISVL